MTNKHLPTQPGTLLGYWQHGPRTGQPYWLVAGADGEITVEPDDNPAPDRDDDEDDDEGDWVAPSRDQWEAAEAGRRKANSEAARRRQEAKALRQKLVDAGIDPDTGERAAPDEPPAPPTPEPDPAPQPDGNRPQQQTVRRQIEREVAKTEARYQSQLQPLLTRVVASELRDAGLIGKNAELAMRLIDRDDIEVGTDGSITGLADQIDQIKAEYPMLFQEQQKPKPRRASGADTVDGGPKPVKPPAPKPKSWAEQVAQQLDELG